MLFPFYLQHRRESTQTQRRISIPIPLRPVLGLYMLDQSQIHLPNTPYFTAPNLTGLYAVFRNGGACHTAAIRSTCS